MSALGQEETNGTATRRKGLLAKLLRGPHLSIVLNEYFEENGAIVFREACRLRRHSVEAAWLALSVRPGCASDADLSAAPPHYRCVVARSVF